MRDCKMRDCKTDATFWLLAPAIALAILTRLYFATRLEIGLDDATSADIAALPLFAVLRFVVWNEPTMGFYYLLLHFWVRVVGSTPFALRTSSILFSVATVPAIYLLGCRLFNRPTGVGAAFILAANATAVEYAQQIKSYSLVILLVTVSSFLFVGLIEQPQAKVRNYWLFAVSGGLAVYAHMHAAFTLIAHAVSTLIRRDVPWLRLFVSGAVMSAVVLPLPLITFSHYQGQSDWITPLRLKSILKFVPFICGAPLFQETASAVALTVACLLLVVAGALAIKAPKRWSFTFALNGLLIPIGLSVLLSFAVRPGFFLPRYLLVCLPFLVLLLAVGIATFRHPPVAVCALVALELWQVGLRPMQYETPMVRTCWKEATDYIFSHATLGDGVVAARKYSAWLFWYYEGLRDARHDQLRLVFPEWNKESFAVGGVYADNPAVPEHPSAKWFEVTGVKYHHLWVIVDSNHDSSTLGVLASLPRSFHTQNERKFPDGLRIILLEHSE
jgi:mannosyltransferase